MGGTSHPAGRDAKLSGGMISNYNSYLRTGNLTGTQGSSYLALAPFELGITETALLDPTSRSGPDPVGNANVMCLTCHRAHASGFRELGRWDFKATFIADSMPNSADAGASGADAINSYYGRDITADFGPYQRQFCNKCHVKD
jgi:hypothetical protein